MAEFIKTKTKADHYSVQKKRRDDFYKNYAERGGRGVVKGDAVEMHETSRGFRTGCYLGTDIDDPSLLLDARRHEVDPGVRSTIHRHSWEAVAFVLEGSGYVEVDGVRYDFKPWDAFHLPSWGWHRLGNEGSKTATIVTVSCEPLLYAMKMAFIEEAGDVEWSDVPLEDKIKSAPGERGNDPYARRLRRLASVFEDLEGRTIHTSYDEVKLMPTKRGSMTTFLIDEALGYQTAGLTAAMKVYAPNEGESMHAHPGEAYLLAVEGDGYSYIGAEPEGGENHNWSAGDLVVVDHWCWHGHNNRSDTDLARVVRMHMDRSFGMIAKALALPLELKLEPDWVFDLVKDPTTLHWPDEKRPEA